VIFLRNRAETRLKTGLSLPNLPNCAEKGGIPPSEQKVKNIHRFDGLGLKDRGVRNVQNGQN